MKRLVALTVALVALPGSGHLWLDGLPFSRPFEVFAAALILIVAATPRTRQHARKLCADRPSIPRITQWALAVACAAKVFTFFWMPFGNGFEACYRSVFNPIEPYRCENSYEMPWGTPWSSLGTANNSRVERHVDFGPTSGWPSVLGASDSTWDLPFANDYPRLGDQWLERIPFTAAFLAYIDSESPRFLPVHGTGDFSVRVGGVTKSSDATTAYAHDQSLVLPVSVGRNELRIDYQHADTLDSSTPDEAPPAKGLSARLFVGEPLTKAELQEVANVRLRVVVVDKERRRVPDKVVLTNARSGLEVEATPSSRPDVADSLNDQAFLKSGFDFEIPLGRLVENVSIFEVSALSSGRKTIVGTVSVELSRLNGLDLRVSTSSSAWTTPQFTGWLAIETEAVKALHPLGNLPPHPAVFWSLTLVLNSYLLLSTLAASILLVRAAFGALLQSVATFAIAALLAGLVWDVRLPFSPSSPLIWVLLLGTIIVGLFRSRLTNHAILAASLFAAIRTITTLTDRFNSIPADEWWGRIIFMSRASDWFVGQGYARQIFLEGSLKGGEALFYFQPGVRYLIFVSHLLLGENDVFISVLLMTALLFAVGCASRWFCQSVESTVARVVALTGAVLVTNAALTQTIATFAVAIASEYPTWVLLFCAVLCIHFAAKTESMVSLLTATAVSALIPNFRPNQLGGSLLLLLLAMLVSWRIGGQTMAARAGAVAKVIAVFTPVALLSLAHNLHYAGSFVLYSTTGNLNSDFSWSSLLTDSAGESLRLIWDKFRLGMYWTNWPILDDLSFSLWGSQLVWLGCLAWLLIRRRLGILSLGFLMLPFAYLLPLLPYRFDSYYPRHIVVIQLAFVLGAMAAVATSPRLTDSENQELGNSRV